jgi:glycosyltransferase involved in cell wall biosynthesis
MKINYFSVLFCVHKDSVFLDLAINSVLNQSYPYFEFLICANNCSDKLFDKLKKIADLDQRIILYRSNIGQLAYCLNYLADISSYDYLVRMDADDICYLNRFDEINNYINLNPDVDIFGASATIIDEHGSIIKELKMRPNSSDIYKGMKHFSAFIHPTVTIKKAALFSLRGYAGGLVSQDYDLWARAKRANMVFGNISVPLLYYRIHSGQESGSKLGYCEVFACNVREISLSFTFDNLLATVIAWIKLIVKG